jgi:integrase
VWRLSTWRPRIHWQKWVIPHLGHVRLADLTPKAIRAWEGKLATCGGRNGRPLGRASVQGARRALSSALEDPVADGVLATNPVKAAVSRKSKRSGGQPQHDVNPWRPEEARAFLAATNGTRWHPVWHLALHTGLRRGELLGLEWGDLDLDRFRLTVARNRVDAGEGGIVEGTAKNGKGRTLSLPETVAVLRKWRTWQEADATLAGEGWTETGKVFTQEDGRPFDPISLRWAFQVALREWGAEDPVPRQEAHPRRHPHLRRGPPEGDPGTARPRPHQHHVAGLRPPVPRVRRGRRDEGGGAHQRPDGVTGPFTSVLATTVIPLTQ